LLFAVACLGAGGQGGTRGAPPHGFVDVAAVAPGIVVDMRYAGSDNFMGRPARGYGAARCLLTTPAARALAAAQQEAAASGLALMVYDCYRPQRAVDDFVAWARGADAGAAPAGQAVKPLNDPRYNPVVPRSELFQRGYIAARSGHSRGSTVDLTLVPGGARRRHETPPLGDCRATEGRLAPDGSLNMGTTFDCFDERAHVADAATPAEARANRARLRALMEKHGFVGYAQEWWHFKLAREPFSDTSFDFEIGRASP
jgi:D-alanyl-D-alanine dipeptidase